MVEYNNALLAGGAPGALGDLEVDIVRPYLYRLDDRATVSEWKQY